MTVEQPPASGSAEQSLSPTDIAQFIRLDQCERYLSLRLRERAEGLGFLRAAGAVPQMMPPLLTRSGTLFEEAIGAALRQHYRVLDLRQSERSDDNAQVVELAQALGAGETLVVLQPRLAVELGGWRLRGDIDLLRLERDAGGALHVLIADMKSSAGAKMEHRLQVAFYHTMLAHLYAQAGVGVAAIRTAIVYRGPNRPVAGKTDLDPAVEEEQRAAAERYVGTRAALLELVPDPETYLEAVQDLVTGPHSTAGRIAATPFADLPFHLTSKCDGCLYNEYCLRWAAAHDDLSLLPHLAASEKRVLLRAGIGTTRDLATLKQFRHASDGATAPANGELAPAPGREAEVRRLAATWPVGPRLDELVHRARRYRRFKGDQIEARSTIPSQGHGSLPYCDAQHNPNLVRIYIDAQHDHLHDRIYMLGALVVGCEGGQPHPTRRRTIVRLTDGPPAQLAQERRLFLDWLRDVLRALVEVAAPDEQGEPRAPIHLIFFDQAEQRLLLDGLARHIPDLLAATPLYDFMTQLAAFDSPIASFLDQEIRELKNYPMLCQSLPAVAAFLKFDWNAGTPYRRLFHERLFDFWGKLDRGAAAPDWIISRARFGSQIPLEYAYAAWDELPPPPTSGADDFAAYRHVTLALLTGFQARRLEALEWIATDFKGNHLTRKEPFRLPDLSQFSDKARTLAHALDEFMTIERHVALHAWKRIRHLAPERRVLMGETLLARYDEADQDEATAAANREHAARAALRAEYEAAAPDGKLTKEQKAATRWSGEGLRLRLRLETAGVDCALDEMLALTTLREGERVVLYPRLTCDSRLPPAQRTLFTPTPRQMLYGPRAAVVGFEVERDAAGTATRAYVVVELSGSRGGADRGFAFRAHERPLADGELYTLDVDPNDWYGSWCAQVTAELCRIEEGTGAQGSGVGGQESGRFPHPRPLPLGEGTGGGAPDTLSLSEGEGWGEGDPSLPIAGNTLYDRIAGRRTPPVAWPAAAEAGQRRFLAGLDALYAAGALHDFEPSKRAYIGDHGGAPLLLVQGPPGTGKSYATGFALFARMQGAMAADRDWRVVVSCKTHSATDVLLANVRDVQARLRQFSQTHPDLFARYFDARLLDVPLMRLAGRETPPAGVLALPRDRDKPKGQPRNADIIAGERWCVVAATPGGIYGLVKDRWGKGLFGHDLCHGLILDEASQMNLPEACMAALLLRSDGQIIVVGDPRQMPPIVQHDWEAEPRRTFQEYRAYESLFTALLPLAPPMIKFAESFRLHADMARFLRDTIYLQDGIDYHSLRRQVLPPGQHADPFVAAVLAPDYPLVVVVHDEAGSQTRNLYEQALIEPVLRALADPDGHALDAHEGLGVVVPHRAQRAALQAAVPALTERDVTTGALVLSAVDTVERFQGGERDAILVSATESDREYLLVSGKFLLDPRRLTVALSRAKRKLILVAARSIFTLFSADEETFANAQLWKHLLRRTCTTRLWAGERAGHRVEVWGKRQGPGTSG